jgi:hypothetical protein
MKFLVVKGIVDKSETIIISEKIDSISLVLGEYPVIQIMINGIPRTINCGNEEETKIAYEGIKAFIDNC